MITDNKRREVAKKMREYNVAAFKESTIIPFMECLGHGYIDWRGILDELADLIDPTCHIVLKPSDSDFNDEPHYLCSRCGKEGIDVYERDDYTLARIVDHANYCSCCGARVVTDDN